MNDTLATGNHMKKHLISLILLALSISNGWALTVRGAVSCGSWVKSSSTESWDKVVNQSRLVAYLSGLAVATKQDILEGTSNESIFLWVDNYCKKYPLDNIYDAGDLLFVELSMRTKTK